jgi:N-acetyl-gamma-glutamylphosphate reductase
LNPTTYIAPAGVAYVRVINSDGCYSIATITLIVAPPVSSDILKDKIICIESKTTLDAGQDSRAMNETQELQHNPSAMLG